MKILTIEDIAEHLAHMNMELLYEEPGTFTPNHVKYTYRLSYGDDYLYCPYQFNPKYSKAPDLIELFQTIAFEALTEYASLDDYFNEVYGGALPEGGLKEIIESYDFINEARKLIEDKVGISSTRYSNAYELPSLLEDEHDEIKKLWTELVSEQHRKELLDNPPLTEEWTAIKDVAKSLDGTDFAPDFSDYGDGYISDIISELADANVDLYYYDLYKWLPDNAGFIEEAAANGLLEGTNGDVPKMIQMGQYQAYTDEMYEYLDECCKHAIYDHLRDVGYYALTDDLIEYINDLSFDASDRLDKYYDEVDGMIQAAIDDGEPVAMTLDEARERAQSKIYEVKLDSEQPELTQAPFEGMVFKYHDVDHEGDSYNITDSLSGTYKVTDLSQYPRRVGVEPIDVPNSPGTTGILNWDKQIAAGQIKLEESLESLLGNPTIRAKEYNKHLNQEPRNTGLRI